MCDGGHRRRWREREKQRESERERERKCFKEDSRHWVMREKVGKNGICETIYVHYL